MKSTKVTTENFFCEKVNNKIITKMGNRTNWLVLCHLKECIQPRLATQKHFVTNIVLSKTHRNMMLSDATKTVKNVQQFATCNTALSKLFDYK